MNQRRALPQRRACETLAVWFNGNLFKVSIGFFENGKPGEVFIDAPKMGTDLSAVARDCAILLSLCLQYEVPIEVIAKALTREASGAPSTIAGNVVDRLAMIELSS